MVLALILSSCVSSRVLEEWPEALPDQALFVQAWREDDENRSVQTDVEYLNWVLRFYEGGDLMSMGWNAMTPAILQGLDAEQARYAVDQRDNLGRMIAAEWAKDNEVREIDSAMLSLWGNLMLAAPEPAQRLKAMDMIANDVSSLLAGNLEPAQINEQRYVQALGISLD